MPREGDVTPKATAEMRAKIEQLALEQLKRMGICPKRIGNGAQQALFHGIKRLEDER